MPGYPVLMIHGLLQSSGAYCTNDDDSLAFFLCKRYVFDMCLMPGHGAVPTTYPHRLLYEIYPFCSLRVPEQRTMSLPRPRLPRS